VSISNIDFSELKDYLNNKVDVFQGGQISKQFVEWRELTSDPEILDTVMGCHITFKGQNDPIPVKQGYSINFSVDESIIIDDEIRKLLGKKVIEPANQENDEIISPIFLRKKPDNSYRLILNLKKMNEQVEYLHFKMESLNSVLKLIKQNCWMASIDLKDAYYSCPMAQKHRKYLKFIWRGQMYQYTVFPNGLACCPRKFTKLLKPVYANLRIMGHISAPYLDDSYLQGETLSDCLENVKDTVKLLDSLGFVVHPKKSVFEPTKCLTFLGFVINSVDMTVRLTQEKQTKVYNACKHLLNTNIPTVREVAVVLGLMTSSLPGVMHGALYYRKLDSEKSIAAKLHKGNFDGKLLLSDKAKQELNWWIVHIHTDYNVIDHGLPSLTIYTDASKTGWGGVLDNQRAGDNWLPDEAQEHINYLELLALFLSLKSFKSDLKDKHIRSMMDNTTGVSCINHMGTCHSEKCNQVTKEIWEFCIGNNIWLSAAHIPGVENVSADRESRLDRKEKEWQLNGQLLKQSLNRLHVEPEIDLFASRINAQYDKYVAYRPDPHAIAIDAFSLTWSNFKCFYMFPPFSVLNQALQKIEREGATGVVIAPYWPTQIWFPMLIRLLINHPLILPRGKHLLRLPQHPATIHPMHRQLQLMVCHLSGNPCVRDIYHRTLQKSSSDAGGKGLKNSTKSTSTDGKCIASQGRLIPLCHL